jgi:hypothetical protein
MCRRVNIDVVGVSSPIKVFGWDIEPHGIGASRGEPRSAQPIAHWPGLAFPFTSTAYLHRRSRLMLVSSLVISRRDRISMHNFHLSIRTTAYRRGSIRPLLSILNRVTRQGAGHRAKCAPPGEYDRTPAPTDFADASASSDRSGTTVVRGTCPAGCVLSHGFLQRSRSPATSKTNGGGCH